MAETTRDRFVYFLLPGLFQAVIGFLTLPLTTRFLGPADFALFALALSISSFAMGLSQMGGIYLVAQRFRSASELERRTLVTTLAAIAGFSSAVFAVLLVGGIFLLGARINGISDITLAMALLLAVDGVCSSLYTLYGTVAVFGFAPRSFAALTIAKTGLGALVTLITLFFVSHSAIALFVGHAASAVVSSAGSVVTLSPYLRRNGFDPNIARQSLRLGGWSAVANLALQARQMIERVLLSGHLGLYDLGLYAHAQQYQNYLMFGVRPMQQAFTPTMIDEAAMPGRPFERTARLTTMLCLTVIAAGLAMALFGREFIGVMTHDKFSASAPYAALLLGVLLVQFSGRPQFATLLFSGGGRYLSLCNLVAVTGSIATLMLLLGSCGIGAAIFALYMQFALYRLMTEISSRLDGSVPFQDAWVLFGVLLIGATVIAVEHFRPDLWIRAMLLMAELGVVAVLGRAVISEGAGQLRQLFSFRGWLTVAR